MKEYFTLMLDKEDLMTIECVLAEKKARLRNYYANPERDCVLYRRICPILNDVRDKLGWND